jgi:hypothetical protein
VAVGGAGGLLVNAAQARQGAEGFGGSAVLGLAACAYAFALALHGNRFIVAFIGGLAFGTTGGGRGEPLVPFVEETARWRPCWSGWRSALSRWQPPCTDERCPVSSCAGPPTRGLSHLRLHAGALASTTVAAPALIRTHGWSAGARPMANHGDMLSTCACHFGTFFGFFGVPILRRCRTAIATRLTPMAIFTARSASEGAVFSLGGSSPVASTVTVTTMARDASQPNTNAAPFLTPRFEGSTIRNAVNGSGSSAIARPSRQGQIPRPSPLLAPAGGVLRLVASVGTGGRAALWATLPVTAAPSDHTFSRNRFPPALSDRCRGRRPRVPMASGNTVMLASVPSGYVVLPSPRVPP